MDISLPKLRTLNDLNGASPCPLDWEQLKGNGRTRFCDVCQQSVLNLSALTREDAEHAIADPSVGCVRLLRRTDGTAINVERSSDLRRTVRLFVGAWAGLLLVVGVGCSDTKKTQTTGVGNYSSSPDGKPLLDKDGNRVGSVWMGTR
jgi:hypothetical protein